MGEIEQIMNELTNKGYEVLQVTWEPCECCRDGIWKVDVKQYPYHICGFEYNNLMERIRELPDV
jgi:hypothetical protein